MARQCVITGKTYKNVTPRNLLRGNFNPAPKRRQKTNLQTVVLPDGTVLKNVSVKGKRTIMKQMKENPDYVKQMLG
jgi:ribosomal protein L28